MRNALALLLIFFAETLVLQLYFNMNKMYPKSHLMLQKYDEERRVWIICWNKLGCLMFLYCTWILTKFEKKKYLTYLHYILINDMDICFHSEVHEW